MKVVDKPYWVDSNYDCVYSAADEVAIMLDSKDKLAPIKVVTQDQGGNWITSGQVRDIICVLTEALGDEPAQLQAFTAEPSYFANAAAPTIIVNVFGAASPGGDS
jgi:hypothetical protein